MVEKIRNSSMGGIIRFVDDKKANDLKKPKARLDGDLSRFNKIDASQIPCDLVDDGIPLKNEFLENLRLKEEKQKLKEKMILENHKEESYNSFVKDLLESSDDIFDSKGDDISKKEYLKNEMDID